MKQKEKINSKKHPRKGEDEVDYALRTKWYYGIIAPVVIFLIIFLVSGKLTQLNPGCTSAYVVSIEKIEHIPKFSFRYRSGKNRVIETRYRVKYRYYVGERNYTFTKIFTSFQLLELKPKSGDHTLIDLQVSTESIKNLPVRYSKTFPWLHNVTRNCDD